MKTNVLCPVDKKRVTVETNCYLCDLYAGEGNENGKDYILCFQMQQEINDKVSKGDHPECLGKFADCPTEKQKTCDYRMPCKSRYMDWLIDNGRFDEYVEKHCAAVGEK